mgnify:CR=1 FL=1
MTAGKAERGARSQGDGTAEGKRAKGTGARRAYEEIRARILTLELRPGQSFDEQEVLATLGLSRTPVREALIRLSAEGLVDLLPNRGARVAPVDMSSVREFLEALDANQRMVTRWAALRRTVADLEAMETGRLAFDRALEAGDTTLMLDANLQFHDAIAAASGNALVARHYRQLLTLGLRMSRISLAYEPTSGVDRGEHLRRISDEHAAMVRAIAGQDADGAEAVAHAHVETFRTRMVDFLSTNLAADMRFP